MLLVFSRFGLSVPALVLDNGGVSQAMFRSDELTEGKWVTLAILLAKSLIGGTLREYFPSGSPVGLGLMFDCHGGLLPLARLQQLP